VAGGTKYSCHSWSLQGPTTYLPLLHTPVSGVVDSPSLSWLELGDEDSSLLSWLVLGSEHSSLLSWLTPKIQDTIVINIVSSNGADADADDIDEDVKGDYVNDCCVKCGL